MKKEYIKPAAKAYYVSPIVCLDTSEGPADPEQGMGAKGNFDTDNEW